jgi:hypothetical protein
MGIANFNFIAIHAGEARHCNRVFKVFGMGYK